MNNIITYPFRFLGFWLWYIGQFWQANFSVLRDIVTPGNDATPGIGRYECHSLTDAQEVLLSVLVTITPGTMVVGAGRDDERGVRILYIHGLYAANQRELFEEIREMEDRMLRGVVLNPPESALKGES